jgi:hypothetical protein
MRAKDELAEEFDQAIRAKGHGPTPIGEALGG